MSLAVVREEGNGSDLPFSYRLTDVDDERRRRDVRIEGHADRLLVADQVDVIRVLADVRVGDTRLATRVVGVGGQRPLGEEDVQLVVLLAVEIDAGLVGSVAWIQSCEIGLGTSVRLEVE